MQHDRTSSFRLAKQAVIKALQYSYRDRRNRKRDLRSSGLLASMRPLRENGTTYRQLIAGLKAANVELDRKVLAELAVSEPKAFSEVAKLTSKV